MHYVGNMWFTHPPNGRYDTMMQLWRVQFIRGGFMYHDDNHLRTMLSLKGESRQITDRCWARTAGLIHADHKTNVTHV